MPVAGPCFREERKCLSRRKLKTLRTYLGRVIRDVGCKTDGNSDLEAAFAKLLPLARRAEGGQDEEVAVRLACCGRCAADGHFGKNTKLHVDMPDFSGKGLQNRRNHLSP